MDSNFKVLALGGLEENGKNLYIIETNDDLIVLDAGISNFSNRILGIDYVIPDFNYLIERKDKIRGIFISHGHFDQMGSLTYLLKEIEVGVYGSNYTISFLKANVPKDKHHLLNIMKYNSVVNCGKLNIESFSLSHAVFGNLGYLINHCKDAIVYVTDYNFNQTTSKFARTDIKKIVKLSNDYNIKLLLTESLAVDDEINSVDYMKPFKRFMEKNDGRKIISLYSSNLTGLNNIMNLAQEYKRKIVIIGRDLLNYLNIAKEYGYVEHVRELFIRVQEISKYEDNQLIIVVAGLYEDPFLELDKMAKKSHNIIKMKSTDDILIASKPTDETEALAQRVVDSIVIAGANITETKINPSSHANIDDIKMMVNLFEPEYVVPIKGEYRKFIHMRDGLLSVGYETDKIKFLKNGDILEFFNNDAIVTETLKLTNQLINENTSKTTNPIILSDREILLENGYILIVMPFAKGTTDLIQKPSLISGGLSSFDDPVIIENCLKIVEKTILATTEPRELVNKIKIKVSRYLSSKIGKNPIVLPVRIEVQSKKQFK